jgi:hypothetical protein
MFGILAGLLKKLPSVLGISVFEEFLDIMDSAKFSA